MVGDLRLDAMFAHLIVSKGVGAEGSATEGIVEDLDWLGYTRLLLKSYNEPAVVQLLGRGVGRRRCGRCSVLQPAPSVAVRDKDAQGTASPAAGTAVAVDVDVDDAATVAASLAGHTAAGPPVAAARRGQPGRKRRHSRRHVDRQHSRAAPP